MADQKQQKAKKKALRRRRRRRTVTLLFVLVILLSVLAVLSCTVLFPIKNVSAKGSKIYSSAEIIKASGITEKDNVLALSKDKVEEKLRRKLSFVDTVEISRDLPDSVQLIVTDAKETSAVQYKGQYYTLSARGYVLECYEECPENTFLLVLNDCKIKKGEMITAKDPAVFERSQNVEKLLNAKKIKINRIDANNSLDINIRVEDRFDVILGDGENLENKINHLAEMIENIGDRKGEIDLSKWSPSNTQGIFKTEN